ncbi:MAG: ferredoxin-thioredoxin reductase catalytic domain-containing protein [Planctomycetaceae bacterium]
MSANHPETSTVQRMQKFVAKYREKSGTEAHPDEAVTESIVLGLASHVEQLGRPLCPCNFYPDKQAELESSRRWVCACDEMKQYKYCHCLLFCGPDGKPITEYLPDDHEGRKTYGVVKDPTPESGREARHQVENS